MFINQIKFGKCKKVFQWFNDIFYYVKWSINCGHSVFIYLKKYLIERIKYHTEEILERIQTIKIWLTQINISLV